MTKVKEETVKHVAELARLKLTASQLKKMQKDLDDILTAFKTLDEAPSAEPSFQPIPMENVLREDAPENCLSNEEALRNTKHKEKGFFKGPRAS